MSRFSPSRQEAGYVKGLFAAYSKGVASADDPAFNESANPYKRFEHRKSWLEGFRWKRGQLQGGLS